jgi:hypothetical protein
MIPQQHRFEIVLEPMLDWSHLFEKLLFNLGFISQVQKGKSISSYLSTPKCTLHMVRTLKLLSCFWTSNQIKNR